jgi:Mg2+ and Co2+ transporter CorA
MTTLNKLHKKNTEKKYKKILYKNNKTKRVYGGYNLKKGLKKLFKKHKSYKKVEKENNDKIKSVQQDLNKANSQLQKLQRTYRRSAKNEIKNNIEKTQKYINHANNNLKSYEEISGLDLDFEKLSVNR